MSSPTATAPIADPFLDFPADDSGATEHVVEPVSHDAEDEDLARLIALFSAPWPFVPAYA